MAPPCAGALSRPALLWWSCVGHLWMHRGSWTGLLPAHDHHPRLVADGDGLLKLQEIHHMLKIVPDPPLFTANPNVSHEDALMHASDLLRCAATSACEFSDSMTGTQRDMTLSIMHLVEMAKVMV
ncbi:Uncharacterized protein ALO91_05186, partial [Pseudomonas syringae pv. aceris]